MPACLIELGYITTPSETAYLTNQANVDAMGKGIYQAFVAYKNKKFNPQQTNPQQTNPQQTNPQPLPAGRGEETPSTDNAGVQANDTPPSQSGAGEGAPVFKVQIMAADRQLSPNDRQFKGLQGIESYKDGNMWKYTVGASENYNEIKQLRKDILGKFPQAFIIAFKNDERVDVNAAIEEFRRNH
jgi:N-acetylmuramoyl-L-alanine amidase